MATGNLRVAASRLPSKLTLICSIILQLAWPCDELEADDIFCVRYSSLTVFLALCTVTTHAADQTASKYALIVDCFLVLCAANHADQVPGLRADTFIQQMLRQ
eukprot:6213367-Pleurochrysis_carterae.AAC.2